MKHYRNLVNESQSLTVFEMLNKLQDFLHEKHGIKAFGAKEDNGFIMFMSSYVTDEEGLHDKDLSEAIKSFVEKEFADLKPITVHKDTYGYHIEFGENKQSAKLVETTQAQGTGMADAKVSYKCHFCGKMEEGYGNDPWPLDTNPTHRVCDKCNEDTVIPARIEKLTQKESKNENTDKKDVEHAASNIVLDDKYTWLFSVLDENGQDVAEGIEYLQDAIDILVRESAAFLVAFPYVDPKPGDPDVEFVFADNPGPVVIYNNEEVTIPKGDLERPSSETQPKLDNEEADEEDEEEAKEVEENVHANMSEEKLQTYLMNAVDIIQELTGLDQRSIEHDIIGTVGTLKVQLLNAMEYIQEISNSKMSDIENMLGCPVNTYVNLATDNSELQTEAMDEDTEEDMEGTHAVHVTFTKEWYDFLEEQGVEDGKEILQNEEALADRIGEMLMDDADIFVSFGAPYWLNTRHDLETSECSYEDSLRAQAIIQDFLGSWADVEVVELD